MQFKFSTLYVYLLMISCAAFAASHENTGEKTHLVKPVQQTGSQLGIQLKMPTHVVQVPPPPKPAVIRCLQCCLTKDCKKCMIKMFCFFCVTKPACC